MPKVIVQRWEESERGWGVRPDGYSLHLTEEARLAYLREYYKTLPEEVPDEYSRVSGSPYEAEVSEEEYVKVVAGSYRTYSNDYPGKPPNDGGWVNIKV